MEPLTIGFIGFGLVIALFMIGIPIAFAMGAVGCAGLAIVFGPEIGLTMPPTRIHGFLASFTFTAVPLFVLMGFFAMKSGLITDAFYAARVWLARLPGGLASTVVIASAMFAACSGSGLPAAITLSRIAVPEMVALGYGKRLATGVIASATPLAVLIPPSITMVVFGLLTETSIARLLIAGIVPGLMIVTIFVLAVTIRAMIQPHWAPAFVGEVNWVARIASGRKVIGIALLFTITIGGLYLGWATPTEGAALGAGGALLLGLAMRRLTFKDVVWASWECVKTMGVTSILLAMAVIFIQFITRAGVTAALAEWFGGLQVSKFVFLLIVSMMYLILGMFMGSTAMMVLTLPFIYPALIALNIDIIWFGILFVVYAEIGSITPPFGITVFGMKAALGDYMTTWEIFQGTFYFLGFWLLSLLILLLFPQISLWLPNVMRGGA